MLKVPHRDQWDSLHSFVKTKLTLNTSRMTIEIQFHKFMQKVMKFKPTKLWQIRQGHPRAGWSTLMVSAMDTQDSYDISMGRGEDGGNVLELYKFYGEKQTTPKNSNSTEYDWRVPSNYFQGLYKGQEGSFLSTFKILAEWTFSGLSQRVRA